MSHREYIPATAEEADHLKSLADEFAQGFPAAELAAKRVPGHPLVLGSERATVVTVRLLPNTLAALELLAKDRRQSRSDVIRRAVERELAAAGLTRAETRA